MLHHPLPFHHQPSRVAEQVSAPPNDAGILGANHDTVSETCLASLSITEIELLIAKNALIAF
jgi:hypothetical protein